MASDDNLVKNYFPKRRLGAVSTRICTRCCRGCCAGRRSGDRPSSRPRWTDTARCRSTPWWSRPPAPHTLLGHVTRRGQERKRRCCPGASSRSAPRKSAWRPSTRCGLARRRQVIGRGLAVHVAERGKRDDARGPVGHAAARVLRAEHWLKRRMGLKRRIYKRSKDQR